MVQNCYLEGRDNIVFVIDEVHLTIQKIPLLCTYDVLQFIYCNLLLSEI